MLDENNVTANVGEVVTPQDTTTEVQTETQTQETTQTQQPATEVQGGQVTETQAFSKRLNEMTQKAIDAEYDRLYGAEYGIHSKADYDKAIAEQQAEQQRQQFQEQNGFDPETMNPYIEKAVENHPAVKAAMQYVQKENATFAISNLNAELKDCGMDLQLKDDSTEELSKLPNIDKITSYVKEGRSLSEAFFLANKKDIISGQMQKAAQDTIKKITSNGESSPGSLSDGGQPTFFTREQVEGMSREEVNKNWKAIMNSQKNWK